MNNKTLAIVLSIVAVIVVIYQVFLRKDEKPVRANRNLNIIKKSNIKADREKVTSLPSINDSVNTDPLKNSNALSNEDSNYIIIDLYSPQLLKRVKPYFDKSKRELKGEVGENIFGYKRSEQESVQEEKSVDKLPILTLNGIIELIRDKIKIAVINDKLYRVGESVENAVIEKIEKYKVFLKFNRETIVLTVNQEPYKGWIKSGGSQ